MFKNIINSFLKNFTIYQAIINLFDNDEHHVISKMGLLVVDNSTHEEINTIVELSRGGYLINPEIIDNILYVWSEKDGDKSLIYKKSISKSLKS